MFKYFALFVIIGCAMANPEPEAKATPEAKAAPNPSLIAPIAAPAVAYTAPLAYSAYSAPLAHSAYSAPLAYSAYSSSIVSPYAATYPVYSPYAAYSAPLIV